jgi:holo-[acyl-carrier protein] synthase
VIGLGLDVVDVARMRATLARTPTMIPRLFTPGERAYAEAAADPTERFAARFAAKEAVMKALGVGLGAFGFHDVEVVRADSGVPSLRLSGRAADLAAAAGVTEWKLSLSHTATVAEAIAIAL